MNNLRDEFALSAFEVLNQAVLLGSPKGKEIVEEADQSDMFVDEYIAKLSYAMADAAMKARG